MPRKNEATDWLTKWLYSRRRQVYNNQLEYEIDNANSIEEIDDINSRRLSPFNLSYRINLINETTPIIKSLLENAKSTPEYHFYNGLSLTSVPNSITQTVNKTFGTGDVLGMYNYPGRYIAYNSSNPRYYDNEYDTPVHENTHAMLNKAAENKIEKIIHNGKGYVDVYDYDPYMDNPVEIYARLNEFRKVLNLKPEQIITEDDINNWKKSNVYKDNWDWLGVDKYNNNQILQLFNDVAYNPKENKENIFAKYGGVMTNTYRTINRPKMFWGAAISGLGSGLSTAGTGASVGSMFGPLGTGIGAGVGGAIGLISGIFGHKSKEKQLAKEAAQQDFQNRIQTAAQLNAAAANTAYADAYRDRFTFKLGGNVSPQRYKDRFCLGGRKR